MQYTSELNKKAWNIRRNIAKRLNCKIMAVSWKECLIKAKECCLSYLNQVTKKYSAFDSFLDLINSHAHYSPTMCTSKNVTLLRLANAYDSYMVNFGLINRAHRI